MAAYVKKGTRNINENRHNEPLVSIDHEEDKKPELKIADEIADAMRSPSAEDRKRFLDYINNH